MYFHIHAYILVMIYVCNRTISHLWVALYAMHKLRVLRLIFSAFNSLGSTGVKLADEYFSCKFFAFIGLP